MYFVCYHLKIGPGHETLCSDSLVELYLMLSNHIPSNIAVDALLFAEVP